MIRRVQGLCALLVFAFVTVGTVQADPALPMAATPEDVGLSSAQLARIEAITQRHIETGLVPGAVMLVARKGKIAWANRQKDPLYLFAALQRHLGYPRVPRPKRPDESVNLLPLLNLRVERLETRLKLLEDEGKSSGIDITKFYGKGGSPLPPVPPPDDL